MKHSASNLNYSSEDDAFMLLPHLDLSSLFRLLIMLVVLIVLFVLIMHFVLIVLVKTLKGRISFSPSYKKEKLLEHCED